MRKYLFPVLLVLVVTIVILKYRTTKFQHEFSNNCINSVNQLYYEGKCYACPTGSSGISWISPGYVECSTSDNRVVIANIKKTSEGFQTTCPNKKSWKCPPSTKEYKDKCYFNCQPNYDHDKDFSHCKPISGKGVDKGISSTSKGCYI